MADRELEILSAITTPKGIRTVYSAGIRAEHFNDAKNRQAFSFALDQWVNDGLSDRCVTEETLTEDFGIDFSIPHGKEPLATSIDALKSRYRREQTGSIVREASRLMADGKHDEVLPYLVDSASSVSWRLQDRRHSTSARRVLQPPDEQPVRPIWRTVRVSRNGR